MTYALADLPMLSGLDAARVRELEGLARRRRYPAGQVLCTEGDPAGELIVLLDGRVRASRAGADGREAVLAAPSAPVAFDKTALLAGLVRLGRSEVTVLDRDALARIGGAP
ncbi:cyclic nucleotide-binding domain-containing protein [Nonomuraea sp. MCN248]|uniref:Cyclic nucleotide-binding domain-containing protein n=1 Tax=Nonomuraea corallina TaxID=2989783 RepID=A0ABT4SBS9_9ACTN|nr:cyclic nucleotide-binding domain-containing protein [Nonomuraea corallina]MDA0634639.1 cyclic nucleotide-binding domain-containing protein [Nonomuraea corallina]